MTTVKQTMVTIVAVVCTAATNVASPQAFPSKQIRLVVAYVAGGTTDITARNLGQKLGENIKQPVLVENRPGANGFIAAESVMKSAADGYTLWIADTGHLAINPAVRPKLPYDPLKDFTPVTQLMRQDFFLVANAALPANSVKDLIELSKTRQGGLSYGSVGTGSVHHLGFERIKQLTGANLVHIPYKGNAQMAPALLAGDVSITVGGYTAVIPYIKAGKIKALAVAASKRSALMPDVPRLAEAGVSGVDINIGVGVLAPAGTPADVVQRLSTEIVKALADPDLKKRFDSLGIEIVGSTPAEYAERIRADLQQYRKIAAEANIHVD